MIRPRILVIDDEETIRKTLSSILLDEGYIVDTAVNGAEALAKSNEISYNLALIDIRLPDMEGTQLLSQLKAAVPKTRKVILTGHPSMSNAIEAVNLNADAYLLKPVNVDDLLSVIAQQLSLQEKEKKDSEVKITEFIETRLSKIKK
ncbi:MAG: response regulator [Candidatus Bathyarchaeota archaeon]|nr:response regulator [Candidatus Bathyarchaeota archaeon]